MEQIDYTSPDFWTKAPERATHWGPSNGSYDEAWFIMVGGEVRRFMRAKEHEWHVYDREMSADRREQLVARPPTWNGTGLPPVGTVCEVDYEGWTKCEVIAHFQQRCGMVAAFTIDQIGNGAKTLDAFGTEHFRPLRTPEQIAEEERENAVAAMHEIYMDGIKNVGGLHALYDAGYRKIDTSQPSPAEISSDIKQANLNRLAEKVMELSRTQGGGMGGIWPVGQNHGGGAMIPVRWRELNELVALAKELKQ